VVGWPKAFGFQVYSWVLGMNDLTNNNPLDVTDFLHASLTASCLEQSLAFYRDILNMEVVSVRSQGDVCTIREERGTYVAGVTGYKDAHLKIAILRYGAFHLELIEYVSPRGEPLGSGTNRPGCPHLAFVVSDLDHAWRVLQQGRYRWNLSFASSGPVNVDSGPNAGGRVIYFRGPDEVTIELVELNNQGTHR
tara:strand:+ start:1102 stop:1680 length:579 start_codon:yes stop_codon:yes gene_type:complete